MGRARLTGVSPVRHSVGPRKRRLTFHQAELVTHPGPPTLDHETVGQLSTVWSHMLPRGHPWHQLYPICSARVLEVGEGHRGSPGTWALLLLCRRTYVPGSTWAPSSASDHSSALSTLLPVGMGVGNRQRQEGRGPRAPRIPAGPFRSLSGLWAGWWGSAGLVVMEPVSCCPLAAPVSP